ncbi:Zn(II)2Cys6 transcription factor [Aspergillus homomorphus CBS 101889]|uniref:C6 finger domain protein n=1 Tax=Aspergillus homomorphus (strain CBS 101889) TaxID=1450537 RepID=A0A395HHW0_ASPHC|nr:C6 finger domain protein [Aspergillus homomorphus CBS 101889]RAL07481.1 C6 finger domain protein [Aspergillus homomorphus CBS 101889]
MQSYSFAAPIGAPREGQKNYVFVDEHNRHKRLKVMRACNGCRKRKIKCDAATTNTWPCSACTRLKLVCVPPTVGQDNDYFAGPSIEPNPAGSLTTSNAPESSASSFAVSQGFRDNGQHTAGHIHSYNDDLSVYAQFAQPAPSQAGTYDLRSSHIPVSVSHHAYQQPPGFTDEHAQNFGAADRDVFSEHDPSTAENLSEVLGELRIDESGIAPYIRQQRREKAEPEIPTQDDADEKLPPLSTGAGSTIRIPPELMPSDDEVMKYFKIYFDDIHPYVPVVHRSHLYFQWQHERSSISPLLLEAMFACAGRLSDDPAQGAQWLALANRHESSFMDEPRLSTIQALLLLLKARESRPKKGYYYRSWQTVKTIVSMAKDLDIHEHNNIHTEQRSCDLSPVECLVQTRVWQALLVVEVMIGAPQGRSDYGVDPGTVNMSPTLDIRGLDQFEIDRSRQYAYFVKNASHIRTIADIYHKIKKQKDWGANPKFVEKNPLFTDWLQSLPPDLQVNYPPDGSPPWIPSHFIGNMHSHCHLGIILLHRPQLLASKSFTAGGGWKMHMALCYSSAKYLCRLQEAILNRFGLSGLLFMQRGINFTIYTVLTCTMLHLVAITSPDPNFHTDAREYFTRHMRILERCSTAWPMPELQAQIDSLRFAFSADVSRPFELKPTFPYGSPSEPYHPSPSSDSSYGPQLNQASNLPSRVGHAAYQLTPPMSTDTKESKSDSSQLQPLGLIPSQSISSHTIDAPLVDENSWDPTRIINQWDMAFSIGPSTVHTNSPPMAMSNSSQAIQSSITGSFPIQYGPPATKIAPIASSQSLPQTQFTGQQVLFTARDWQQSVASVYDPNGLKRRWNYSIDMGAEEVSKRQLP